MEKLTTKLKRMRTLHRGAPVQSPPEKRWRVPTKAAGYDAIIITDHFFGETPLCRAICRGSGESIFTAQLGDEARRVGEEIGLKVFFGLE